MTDQWQPPPVPPVPPPPSLVPPVWADHYTEPGSTTPPKPDNSTRNVLLVCVGVLFALLAAVTAAALGSTGKPSAAPQVAPTASTVPEVSVTAKRITTTTTEEPTTTTTSHADLMDRTFVSYVHEKVPSHANGSDAKLIELGHEICTTIEQYGSVRRYIAGLITSGKFSKSEQDDLARISGAAIAAYCPEYSGEL